MKKRTKKRAEKSAIHAVLIVILLLHVIPFVTILVGSMRSDSAIAKQLLALPSAFDLSNYPRAWVQGDYLTAFVNTFVIDTGTVLIVLFVEILAAYGLTKLNVYGKQAFIGYFVVAIAVPAFAILVPLFFAFQKLGLVDTKIGIILIYSAIFMPFTLLFMRSFFLGIPRELEEAALVDGCSEFGALRRITLPLAVPMVSTVALIVFVNSYNEFLFANVFLSGTSERTVALAFYNFVAAFNTNYGEVFAAAIMTLVPILVLYLVLQRRFIEGMAAGGLKG